MSNMPTIRDSVCGCSKVKMIKQVKNTAKGIFALFA